MDGEPTRHKQGAGETTHCEHWMEGKTRLQQALPQGRTVKWPGIGRWHRVVHWLPGKPAEGRAPHGTLIRTVTGWGLGQVCRKVSHGSRVSGKQVLVRQVMCREQESSHLEQPDCILFYMINIILGEFISLFLSFTLQANIFSQSHSAGACFLWTTHCYFPPSSPRPSGPTHQCDFMINFWSVELSHLSQPCSYSFSLFYLLLLYFLLENVCVCVFGHELPYHPHQTSPLQTLPTSCFQKLVFQTMTVQ